MPRFTPWWWADQADEREPLESGRLPLKVTKSVPALGSPSGVLALRLLKQSAETVRSEPSPPLPDLRLRSPALFQNCGGIIERFTGHDKNALSKALLRIADRRLDPRRTWMIASNSFSKFKMDQYKPRTSVPEACLTAP